MTSKQKQLILSFIGRAETPYYANGGLAVAIARLRRDGLVKEQYLTRYGQIVATALANGQPVPSRGEAMRILMARAGITCRGQVS